MYGNTVSCFYHTCPTGLREAKYKAVMLLNSSFKLFNLVKSCRTITTILNTSKNYTTQPPPAKSFEDQLMEALENFKDVQTFKKEVRKEAESEMQQIKEEKWREMRKHKLKKRNWVDYVPNDAELSEPKRHQMEAGERIKRKKCAIMLGYCGANYFGMQRNPGMETIEEFLLKAMYKHNWITKEAFEFPQDTQFQRAARTDKGVSAARQVCSLKLPEELDLIAFNKDLPEDIRLFGVERVTKGFNSKDQCNARTYAYTMPTIAFADCSDMPDFETYRIDAERLQKITEALHIYEGTKNYHNFTSKKHFIDPSAKRFMMSFTCSTPFLSPQSIEFVTLKVKGQSFMLHQIRKMVGLTIAIVRGNTTMGTMDLAFTEKKVDLPRAPGLGLVLDTVHYERYNNRYGNDGIHNPLTWEEQEPQVKEFVEKHINPIIYKTEYEQRPMIEWLETLSIHTYDVREENAADDETEENDVEVDDEVDDNVGKERKIRPEVKESSQLQGTLSADDATKVKEAVKINPTTVAI